MKWLTKLMERRDSNPNDMWGPYQALRTGPVNDKTAQGVSAAYACVQAISEAVATLPFTMYRRDGQYRQAVEDHPLHNVLNVQANPRQTAMEAREYVTASVLLKGNGYARIVHGNDGQVRELWPLDPDRVQALILPNKSVVYEWADEQGVMHRSLPAEMLHLRHRLGPDGVLGVSPIQAARGVVEMAIKEVEHGNETFTNGAKLLGVLKVPGKLSPTQKGDIKEGWQTNRSGQTPILEHGAEFQQLSMSLVDAQWLESRKFSVEEVARLFRVPPPIIGHLVDSNYSTASELARQWIAMGLSRPLVMWEQAVSIKCLTSAGRRTYTVEHDYEGLLRGSSLERAQFYQSAITAGWMDKDEVRRMEYLPKQEGGPSGQTQDA